MAESKTEKAKQKAAEVQEAVRIKSEEAEKKIKDSVKAAEQGMIGKHIPTSLDSLSFRDIIKLTLVLNSILTIGFYCIITAAKMDTQTGVRKLLLTISNWVFIIFGVGGIIIDSVFFFAHLFNYFKIFVFFKLIKVVAIILYSCSAHYEGWINIISTIAYGLSCVAVDLCFVYYLAIYEERVASDEYDENGMLKSNEKREEP